MFEVFLLSFTLDQCLARRVTPHILLTWHRTKKTDMVFENAEVGEKAKKVSIIVKVSHNLLTGEYSSATLDMPNCSTIFLFSFLRMAGIV